MNTHIMSHNVTANTFFLFFHKQTLGHRILLYSNQAAAETLEHDSHRSSSQDFVVVFWQRHRVCLFQNFFLPYLSDCSLDIKHCFVYKAYFHLFRLRSHFTSLLRFKFEGADSFGSRESEYETNWVKASWLCTITTWNCWVMSLSCSSLFI